MAKKKILIVEDEFDTQLGLGIRLESCNYECSFASDAISALTMAMRFVPDLILLDLGLPKGDGFEVMKHLKTLPTATNTPIVVLTAWNPEPNKERALKAGAACFFQKPADMTQLLATIADLLSKPPAPLARGGAPKKILLIEDDADTRKGLMIRLLSDGYDIAFAPDAGVAIGMALREKPDLILLDLQLPQGNGIEVLERLKRNSELQVIPVIVLTVSDPKVYRERCLKLGAYAFFEKPPDNQALMAAIRDALEQSTQMS